MEICPKVNLSFEGVWRAYGGMGVCGNHWKWLQRRPCKILCKSVWKTPIPWQNYFLILWKKCFGGLSALRAHTVGICVRDSLNIWSISNSQYFSIVLDISVYSLTVLDISCIMPNTCSYCFRIDGTVSYNLRCMQSVYPPQMSFNIFQ